ncbi:MAG: hypothetical protein V4555_18330, partial [Acidobacteriota bacterium]
AWRWVFWLVVWVAVWLKVGTAAALVWQEQMSSMMAMAIHGSFVIGFSPTVFAHSLPAIGVFLVVWAMVSGVGRGWLWPRIDSRVKARRGTLIALAVMRVVEWAALIGVWVFALVKTWVVMVQGPSARGEYPSYVPGFAIVLFVTLGLFMLWCVTSWVFRLAAVLAGAKGLGVVGSLRAAWGSGAVRGKLIEINLVMGIVKVALVVLAMVFLACPLPFSAVETQAFLTCWWCGVGLLWVVASDYFHVVRAAAYVTLWRAYDFSLETAAPGVEAAS